MDLQSAELPQRHEYLHDECSAHPFLHGLGYDLEPGALNRLAPVSWNGGRFFTELDLLHHAEHLRRQAQGTAD